MKRLFIVVLCLVINSLAYTQDKIAYSPLMDPAVKVLNDKTGIKQGEYLWYPGQLSSHLQQKRKKESEERCVYVGYPGKFYAPVYKTFFRKKVTFLTETNVTWQSTGNVKMFVNGKHTELSLLPKGKSTLLFEVETANDLPAIKVSFNEKVTVDGWESSLDGKMWNFAETSSVFGVGGKTPLDDPERHVIISPVSILPVRNATAENGKIMINKNGYVLIDFFHLEVGKVALIAKGKGQLTATFGESVEEALNEEVTFFEQRPVVPYTLSLSEKQITLPERAVRYIKLFCDGQCELSSVELTAKVWPVDFLTSFECSEERINRIWNASVASLHTNMHGFYLDGIKRDFLPWAMDGVLCTFGGDYLFGDRQVSLNCLSMALMPYNPQVSDIGIPDYPLYAIIGFNRFLKRYGDMNVILSYRDRIEQLLRFYETLQDENGFIKSEGTWGFVPGWATKQGPDTNGTPAYAQILLYLNFKTGAILSDRWGDKKTAKYYRAKAEALKESILKHFWSEDKKLFINGYTSNNELDERISHHAQYWAIIAGIFPENHYDNLFEILPAIPYYKEDVSYEKGYEFMAYSKARRVRDMWDFLFDVFGDWLEQGHSRFPEHFKYMESKNRQLVFYDRPYGLSLCHGVNGMPGIIAVMNGIVGFSQSDTQPDYYTISPDMMDMQWANIEFPIKEGKVKLKLLKEGAHEVEIPAGCKVLYIRNGKQTVLSKQGVYKIN